MNRSDIIHLTEEIGFLPESKFGQNFLCDEDSCKRIVDLCELRPGDKVLEIGPGLGALTEELTARDIDLTAIEIDKRLAEYIDITYGCRVIASDYTKLDAEDYNAAMIDVAVSNVPYYLMTPIMKKLITELSSSRRLVLMVEKEALARILAKPCTKQYGPLSILCSLYGDVTTVFDLPGNMYYPMPKTTSSVITFTRKDCIVPLDGKFAAFLESAFRNRRKKLLNNIDIDKEILFSLGYSEQVRAEELSPSDFARIYMV